jgi:hypothetical protein
MKVAARCGAAHVDAAAPAPASCTVADKRLVPWWRPWWIAQVPALDSVLESGPASGKKLPRVTF